MKPGNLIIAPVIFSLTVLFSCEKRPKKVTSDAKMVAIMADMEMAQAYIQSKGYKNRSTDNNDRILLYILEKNGMSREEFDSTMSWYGRNIDKYDELYSKVDKELAKRESKISGNAIEALSNDLWPYTRHLIISSKSSTDNLSFSISDPEIDKGMKLTWKFHLNIPSDGTVLLGVKYSDGVAGYLSQTLSGNNIEIGLQTDSAKIVKSVFGNLHLNSNRSFVGIDSLSLSAVPFDSTSYYRINSVRKYSGPRSKKILKIQKDSIAEKDSLETKKS